MSFLSSLTDTPSHIASALCSLVLIVVIVSFSFRGGGRHLEWAYHVGDQPLWRLVFLVLIAVAAHHREFFPVALLLALLFMIINSMVPMLTELDENFVFGAPLTDCSVYKSESVQEVGTPFYPMSVNGQESRRVDGVQTIPYGEGATMGPAF
jgi:predicted membrane metal-binding protein